MTLSGWYHLAMLVGALIGLVVATVFITGRTIGLRRQAAKGTGMPGQLEQAMRGKGPLNLRDISALVGYATMAGQGKVQQSLNALRAVGKVDLKMAPPGTPLRQIQTVSTYELIA